MNVVGLINLPPAITSIASAAIAAERRAGFHADYDAPANQEIAEADAARLWREALAYIGNDGEAWDNRRGR